MPGCCFYTHSAELSTFSYLKKQRRRKKAPEYHDVFKNESLNMRIGGRYQLRPLDGFTGSEKAQKSWVVSLLWILRP